jgi:hypothetical protein
MTTKTTRFSANAAIAAEGLTWKSPFTDLVDALSYALGDANPSWSWERCCDKAEAIATRRAR